jgi:N-acetylglutamate synthase-like GNAT family acetyltransferase
MSSGADPPSLMSGTDADLTPAVLACGMEVREAVAGDGEAIREVVEAAWYAGYSGFLTPQQIARELDELYDPEFLERVVGETEGLWFLVCEQDGEVVGFASAAPQWADEAELFTLYVDPDRWGEGAGSALLAAIEVRCRDEGIDRLACSVFCENYAGFPFLESRGFERLGETRTEFGGSVQREYEYEKRL